jgi:hypothetical protein
MPLNLKICVCLSALALLRTGGPDLISSKSGAPYLDSEMWAFARQREPEKIPSGHRALCQDNRQANFTTSSAQDPAVHTTDWKRSYE